VGLLLAAIEYPHFTTALFVPRLALLTRQEILGSNLLDFEDRVPAQTVRQPLVPHLQPSTVFKIGFENGGK
jgi:hypothetical protein